MRLFFSVPLPQEAKDRAARALAPARAAAGELSWTKPEQMHLTLAFLGEQPPEALERIFAFTSGSVLPSSRSPAPS